MKLVLTVALAVATLSMACGVVKKKQSYLDEEDAAAQAADAAAVKYAGDEADASRQFDAARLAYIEKGAKACHVKPSEYTLATKRDMAKQCVVQVDGGLKVQGSATWPDLPDENDRALSTTDGCVSFFDTYVDAQNALGVKVRTRYRCSYDPRIGIASYKTL